MATRDEYLEQVDSALAPVRELLLASRMGVERQFNPLIVQIGLEVAKVNALAALAASAIPVSGEVLELATEPGLRVVQQPPPPAGTNGSGLVLPS